MAYNVLGAQSRKAGADASIELVDDEGVIWGIATDNSANSLIIKRGSTTVVTLKDGTGATASTGIRMDVRTSVVAPNNAYGMAAYFDTTITGTVAGHSYGLGSWINSGSSADFASGHIIVPFEGGVYTGEAQASARIVFAGQHQAILNGAPDTLHAWRLNTTQTVTAVIAAANAGSVGYVNDSTTDSTKVGDVPLFDIVGYGVRWVRVYDAAS